VLAVAEVVPPAGRVKSVPSVYLDEEGRRGSALGSREGDLDVLDLLGLDERRGVLELGAADTISREVRPLSGQARLGERRARADEQRTGTSACCG